MEKNVTLHTTRWSCTYVRTLGLPEWWIEWHDTTSDCDGTCVPSEPEGRTK